jgi:hypothetical protein
MTLAMSSIPIDLDKIRRNHVKFAAVLDDGPGPLAGA